MRRLWTRFPRLRLGVTVCLVLAAGLTRWGTSPGLAEQTGSAPESAAASDERPPGGFSSGLSRDLLDDLLPTPPPAAGDAEKRAPPPTSDPGEDVGAPPHAAPLAAIKARMIDVTGRLREQQVDSTTRQMQDEILAALNELIDQLDQSPPPPAAADQQPTPDSASQAATSQSAAEQQPAGEDAATQEEGEELLARDSLKAVWGELPERLRKEIQSPLREEFLPAYRQLIIEYFKQLAQRRP